MLSKDDEKYLNVNDRDRDRNKNNFQNENEALNHPKCFLLCPTRETYFVTMILDRLGLLLYFSSQIQLSNTYSNQSNSGDTSTTTNSDAENNNGPISIIPHVIGKDHPLMQENNHKIHIIVLKLIHYLKKEHNNVLYVGCNKDVIDHMSQIQACNTYFVKTKGMLFQDMKKIERKFVIAPRKYYKRHKRKKKNAKRLYLDKRNTNNSTIRGTSSMTATSVIITSNYGAESDAYDPSVTSNEMKSVGGSQLL